MADWVKCTGINGFAVYVNLSSATYVARASDGASTLIGFAGQRDNCMTVSESPDQIIEHSRLRAVTATRHDRTA
jgi:hypothetical protein